MKMQTPKARPGANPSVRAATSVGASRSVAFALVLTVVGAAIAGYLSWSDLTGGAVECAGLGDCDAAHASAYSAVLGVPVSYLGFVAYAVTGALLALRTLTRGETSFLAVVGAMAMSVAGAVFSCYLTYTAFFVIRAVCPWCVASAITVNILAVVLYRSARRAALST